MSATERENKRLHDEWLETAIEYKVEWERELERRKKLGIEAAVPVPTLYCLVIIRHGRRFWVSFGVTTNPTAEWVARQITECAVKCICAGSSAHMPTTIMSREPIDL